MTDFEYELLEDMYTWADATNFDIKEDVIKAFISARKTMIDAYWKDYFGA